MRHKDRRAQQALATRRLGWPRLLNRLLAIGVLGMIGVLAFWPASFVGWGLQRLTGGQLTLAHTEGRLWEGQGVLSAREPSGLWQPVMPLRWTVDARALWRAQWVWHVFEATRPLAHIALHPRGLRLEHVQVDLPLKVVLGGVPHTLAHAGWRGDLRIETPALHCTWAGGCAGYLAVFWRNAGVDIAPHQPFGDYRLSLDALGHEARFQLETLQGSAIRLQGSGQLAPVNSAWRIDVEGPPDIVDRLPNVMGGLARRGHKSGLAHLEMPLRAHY